MLLLTLAWRRVWLIGGCHRVLLSGAMRFGGFVYGDIRGVESVDVDSKECCGRVVKWLQNAVDAFAVFLACRFRVRVISVRDTI